MDKGDSVQVDYYKPLAEVRKELKVKWYRVPLPAGELKNFMKRSDLQGFYQVFGHLLAYVGIGVIAFYFWSSKLWIPFVVTLFFHGTVASFMTGVAPHELAHGTVFRTKWLNKAFMYVFSLLSWWDPFDYGTSHTYHHRYTMYPEGDRENLLPLEPNLGFLLILQLFTVNLFGKPSRVFSKGGLLSTVWITFLTSVAVFRPARGPIREWIYSLHNDQPVEKLKSIWWSRILMLFHASVIIAGTVSGLWVLPVLVSSAAFIGNWLSYLVGTTQHCGLRDNVPDFRKSTRSIKIDPLTSFFYWRMNWHTEHHMYAGVPCYHLKKLAKAISHDMPAPRSLIGAWIEMRHTWKQQKINSAYQFDTPLPTGKPSEIPVHNSFADGIESSIGDIAPKTLAEES